MLPQTVNDDSVWCEALHHARNPALGKVLPPHRPQTTLCSSCLKLHGMSPNPEVTGNKVIANHFRGGGAALTVTASQAPEDWEALH